MREFLNGDRWTMPETVTRGRRELVVPLRLATVYKRLIIAETLAVVRLHDYAPQFTLKTVLHPQQL